MRKEIHAIKVRQWLSSWENIKFDPTKRRCKPEPYFYLFNISAKSLKKLSGVYRRSALERKSAAEEFGIQRKHDPERSKTIQEYVKNGYPWSDLNQRKRDSGEFADLKQPGWLPTAIVVNILKSKDERRKKTVAPKDLIEIKDYENTFSKIILPRDFDKKNWTFEQLPPVEIIDGQHRLWAFEEPNFDDTFELPVVAFYGLDISWQAYLFYTINISPKKINRSLAYDLYPLLRTEEWLEKFEGHVIYRETRAQDLVDLLYSQPRSPWYQWINMLGDTGGGKMVSQSAWIKSLLATYVRSYEGRSLGGLFGAKRGDHETVLPWGREEQAALLIYIGDTLKKIIESLDSSWTRALRNNNQLTLDKKQKDQAFYGKNTLLNQDQGIRALLYITNDYLYLLYDDLNLEKIFTNTRSGTKEEIINKNIDELKNNPSIAEFLKELLINFSHFDWRSYSAPNKDLTSEQVQIKAGYRGSGGYKVLRRDVLNFLIVNSKDNTSILAKDILKAIGE
ncbi:MAG: hypothetical protein GF317_10055 [Candidatus Lokiarchaeota archaeon]|nr:hypothetical protein [Candidatus Lokiarchaeota archaeon]